MAKFAIVFIWAIIFKTQFLEIASDSCRHITYNREDGFSCKFKITNFPTKNFYRNKFSNTQYLFALETTNCEIASIDLDTFTDYPSLMKLNLGYNNLTELRQFFPTQTQLRELSFSHNRISWIHLDAFKMNKTTLQLLDLSFNTLHSNSIFRTVNESGRSVFGLSESLEKLDLTNNKLEALDRGTFSNNSNLLYLNLSKNSLTEVKLRAFDKLSKLIYLNLSGNLISKLDLGFPIGLKSLQILDLSFNRLFVLDSNLFHNTPMLGNLQLHNNFLKNISIVELKSFTKLRSITIHDNNIDCSLLLKILKELQSNGINVDEGSATESYSFHGISCNISSTTEKYLETTNSQTSETPSRRKDLLQDFENVFINSTFYEMFSEFIKNQKESVNILEEINAKKIAEEQILKEITLKNYSGNETLDAIRQLSASVSAGDNKAKTAEEKQELIENFTNLQNVIINFKKAQRSEENRLFENFTNTLNIDLQNILINFIKDSKAQRTEENKLFENFTNAQNILINFMEDNKTKNNKSFIFDITNNIFQFVIILLLIFMIYLSYAVLTKRSKTKREAKEMQPLII